MNNDPVPSAATAQTKGAGVTRTVLLGRGPTLISPSASEVSALPALLLEYARSSSNVDLLRKAEAFKAARTTRIQAQSKVHETAAADGEDGSDGDSAINERLPLEEALERRRQMTARQRIGLD